MDSLKSYYKFASGPQTQRAFRWLTMPYRMSRRWSCARRKDFPISILFYHRVADSEPNPWTIENGRFREQVDWLQERFELIDLAEVQRRLRARESARPAVSITFDDGYADNLDYALPLLIERQIPCTYFVSWSYIVEQRSFPHDVMRGAALAVDSARSIRALADAGIEIGSHSLSHCDFGQVHDEQRLRTELVDSRRQIEDAIGKPVRYFAFPYGQRENLSPAAFAIGSAAGYHAMCSAYGGYNFPGRDAFHLQRIHGDPRTEYLKNWLDFDPRMERVAGYDYEPLPSSTAQPLHVPPLAKSSRE
jgi:peptidoglycan/xylan/chitin deacetylase (PgdA/CDA1 family)